MLVRGLRSGLVLLLFLLRCRECLFCGQSLGLKRLLIGHIHGRQRARKLYRACRPDTARLSRYQIEAGQRGTFSRTVEHASQPTAVRSDAEAGAPQRESGLVVALMKQQRIPR
jgi:hypothetical protein